MFNLATIDKLNVIILFSVIVIESAGMIYLSDELLQ